MVNKANVVPLNQNSILYKLLEERVTTTFESCKEVESLDDYFLQLTEGITTEELLAQLSEYEILLLSQNIKKASKLNMSIKEVEFAFNNYLKGNKTGNALALNGDIFEENGQTFTMNRKTKKFLSNFILEPQYMITRRSNTAGGGIIHENLYCYKMIVRNTNFDIPQVSLIILRSSDFDDLRTFQEATKKIGGRLITGNANVIAQYGSFVLNKPFPVTKFGSDVFGLDVINGKKYYITPQAVYCVETGAQDDSIVYMPSHESDPVSDFKLTNLQYDPTKWKETIAPFFMKHILKIQKKDIMLLIVGWLTAIPMEYIFRKLTNELAGFPHAMITGVNGGGKTVLATSLLPYLGYSQDAELLNFGGKVANIQSIDWSYNTVVIFDEYRPNEWADGERKAVERLIRESYGRSEDRKSNTNYNVRKFVRKNPMMILGQMTTSDDANSERIIQMYLDPNFMNEPSDASAEAKAYSKAFQEFEDKNFWVGFSIWMMQQSQDNILKVYREFKEEVVVQQPNMKDRLRCFCAIVMTGLYYFGELAEDLGLSVTDIGYDIENIMSIPEQMSHNREATQGDKVDLLEEFLNDIVSYGITFGNRNGDVFGKGRHIQIFETYKKSSHVWGKNDEEAIINDRKKIVLIKVDSVITLLNKHLGKKYDDKLLNPILKSYYDRSKIDPLNAIVLAPSGYRVYNIRYAAFDFNHLVNRGFDRIEDLTRNDFY